jgi:GxxExxY protein
LYLVVEKWCEHMTRHAPIPREVERYGKALLDAAFEVHTVLGAGFLERVYEDALCHELTLRRVPFARQEAIVVPYKGLDIEGQRLDLVIGGLVIAELKAASAIHPVHQAQLMSYLKATGLRLGFIINFNVPHLKDGIQRVVM